MTDERPEPAGVDDQGSFESEIGPGWYPDPTDPGQHRWWDGVSWTTHVLGGASQVPPPPPTSAPVPSPTQLRPVGEWFSGFIALARARAGHIFTLIVAITLPASVLAALLVWPALGGVIVRNFQPEQTGDELVLPELVGMTGARYAALAAALVLTVLSSTLLAAAIAHQLSRAGDEEPATWVESAGFVLGRWRSLLAVLAGLVLAVAGPIVIYGVLMAVSAAFVLLLPLVLVVVVLAIVRLSLALTAAAVGPEPGAAFKVSASLSKGSFWPITGRLLLLTAVAATVAFVGSALNAPIASLGGAEPIDSDSADLAFDAVLGDLPSFVAGRIVGTVLAGISSSLWAAGMLLIYLDRGGQLGLEPIAERVPAPTNPPDELGLGR